MASWAGATTYATKKQLVSSISGLYDDIQDISGVNFFNLDVSTLTASKWISTPVLYVSDIQGATIDISGISITKDGVFNAPIVSLSSLGFKGFDSLLDLDVSFDLGLGQALGGLLGGLGALVGGGLIGVGTGAGLAVQGAATGIATMVAGRGTSNITSNTFETINFTSQLQVSTLGNLYPAYSTIIRTVSSVSPNQVPGPEIILSTVFSPGQICIRSVSDPLNLITGNSNVNTSTIQSFGQWVPLQGLEPEDIFADSISTNNISAGSATVGLQQVGSQLVENLLQIGKIGNPGTLSLPFQSDVEYELGTGLAARVLGDTNYWWNQTDGDLVWSKTGATGTTPINARLSLGTLANQSYLEVSSIFSRGYIQGFSGFFSTLTVEALTVVSTVNLTSTNVENITSSATVEANNIYANYIQTSTLHPFTFVSTSLVYPSTNFDITRFDYVNSTTYDQVSSLQQNILNYSLNIEAQTEPSFNIGPGTNPADYQVTPQNINQWGSTILIYDNLFFPGIIDLGWVGQWGPSNFPGGATFDVAYTTNSQGSRRAFVITENSNQFAPLGTSTLVSMPFDQTGGLSTFRFTLPPVVGGTRSGWWDFVTPAPPPYATSNNNTFQIYQDINDTYIQGTDRLHLVAGDLFMDGQLNLSNIAANSLNGAIGTISTLNANNASISTLTVSTLQTAIFSTTTASASLRYTGSVNDIQPYAPLQTTFTATTTDFLNQRTLTIPSRGPNMFNSYNIPEWNNTVFYTPTGTNATTGPPQIYLGDLIQTSPPPGIYSAQFYVVNNTIATPPIPIYSVETGGWLSTVGYAGTSGTGVTLVQTSNGINDWRITCNVTNPQGSATATYSNFYTVGQQENVTTLNVGMPLVETMPSRTIKANKVLFNVNQIRCLTYASPSFASREAGFELASYFDADIVYSGSESDAVNNIISPAGSLGYACIAWSAQIWFNRIRTDSLGIQGFECEAVVSLISGSFADFIWASHRYINVNSPGNDDNLREQYLMIPTNWMTYEPLLGPY